MDARAGRRERAARSAPCARMPDGPGVPATGTSAPTEGPSTSTPAGSSPDRDVLAALYDATGGANWSDNSNWLSDAPIGEWHGVTTDGSGRVTQLALSYNELTGTIPASLGGLSNLQYLELSNNQLTGAIPAELGSLTNLQQMWLQHNQRR